MYKSFVTLFLSLILLQSCGSPGELEMQNESQNFNEIKDYELIEEMDENQLDLYSLMSPNKEYKLPIVFTQTREELLDENGQIDATKAIPRLLFTCDTKPKEPMIKFKWAFPYETENMVNVSIMKIITTSPIASGLITKYMDRRVPENKNNLDLVYYAFKKGYTHEITLTGEFYNQYGQVKRTQSSNVIRIQYTYSSLVHTFTALYPIEGKTTFKKIQLCKFIR